MKNTFRILLAFALAFIALHSAAALEAKVLSTSGKVEIQKGSAWVPLNTGDVVYAGDVISTGFKSSAELSIQGSKVQLGPLTLITIEKLVSTSSKNETSIYLDSGKIDATVNKADGKRTGFKVSTPVATASVRGTSFSMNAAGFLFTSKGLVAKMPSMSKVPQVSDTPSDFTPADGETNAFTSVKDVSGGMGIPVYEGEYSSTDPNTGLPVYPQKELAKRIIDIRSGTLSQTVLEKLAPPIVCALSNGPDFPDPASSAPALLVPTLPAASPAPASPSGDMPTEDAFGSLVVTVTF